MFWNDMILIGLIFCDSLFSNINKLLILII